MPAAKKVVSEDAKPLSADADLSTYKVNTDLEDTTPNPGRHVLQELGTPKES